ITADELALKSVICFCDIPQADFQIHMKKYSPFGLAFSKEVLIEVGASPVFYISKNSRGRFASLFNIVQFKERIANAQSKQFFDLSLLFDANVSGTIN